MLRSHSLYFDASPSQGEVLAQLQTLTSKKLHIQAVSENYFELNMDGDNNTVNIQWILMRKIEEYKRELGESFVLPFPEKKQCIKVSSEDSRPCYLEISLIYLLRQMGGLEFEKINLPKWAGKPFSEISKKGLSQWLDSLGFGN